MHKPKQISFAKVKFSTALYLFKLYETYEVKDKYILTLMSDHILPIELCMHENNINRRTVK
jgi:hypothetical protein